MSRYDGLIIPRSYSEYINKTDAATLQQALQLSGVLSGTVAAGDNKAVKSAAVSAELNKYEPIKSANLAPNQVLDTEIIVETGMSASIYQQKGYLVMISVVEGLNDQTGCRLVLLRVSRSGGTITEIEIAKSGSYSRTNNVAYETSTDGKLLIRNTNSGSYLGVKVIF